MASCAPSRWSTPTPGTSALPPPSTVTSGKAKRASDRTAAASWRGAITTAPSTPQSPRCSSASVRASRLSLRRLTLEVR